MAGQEVDVVEAAQVVGMADVGFEWDTVHVEAARQISFDTDGDVYIGRLVECEWIDPQDPKRPGDLFLQAKFEDPDGVSAINCGYELRSFFAPSDDDGQNVIDTAKYGFIFRIERRRTVDVDQASPMVSFRIQQARGADNRA
jgi:hypothetical protein